MRVKVTTEIDGGLRLMYEAIQDPSKPTLRQLIERGMTEYLHDKDPAAALKVEIETGERNLRELREKLAEMRILEPQQKRMQEYEIKEAEQQKRLEEWFMKNPARAINGVKRGWLNYKRVATQIGAKSAAQAEEQVHNLVSKWELEHKTN